MPVIMMIVGTSIFSGTLYLIAMLDFKKLGMVEGQTFSLLRIDGSKKYFQFRNDNIFKS